MTNPSSSSHPSDLPSSRSKSDRGVRKDVRPPFMRVSISTFLNILTAVLLAVLGWYIYHSASLALGMVRESPPGSMNPLWPLGFSFNSRSKNEGGETKAGGRRMGVEKHIAALAEELGMGKDSDLAVAIADAVREHVPPASLSALAAQAKETGSSRVVEALVRQSEGGSDPSSAAGAMAEALGKVVGMDDTPGLD